MTRLRASACFVVVCGSLGALSCLAQNSSSGSASTQGAAPNGAATQAQGSSSTAASADTKKKKVWTNDDVSGLNGPISVVGDKKNSGKPGATADGKADPQYIANTKKQLEKLQSQLDDTSKQLTALKDFSAGKQPEPTGYPISKGYNRVPVDQQIAGLEDKKKQLEERIGALLDEARKKGVLPGQLR